MADRAAAAGGPVPHRSRGVRDVISRRCHGPRRAPLFGSRGPLPDRGSPYRGPPGVDEETPVSFWSVACGARWDRACAGPAGGVGLGEVVWWTKDRGGGLAGQGSLGSSARC